MGRRTGGLETPSRQADLTRRFLRAFAPSRDPFEAHPTTRLQERADAREGAKTRSFPLSPLRGVLPPAIGKRALRCVIITVGWYYIIWARAVGDGAVIITKDEDFALLAASNAIGPKILWVRTGNLVNRLLLARFERAWPDVETHLSAPVRVVELC